MCLLTFLPGGVLPDTAALHAGTVLNRDGHGFAIVAGDQLIVRKGLDGPQLVEAFDTVRRQHPHGPALFHSRFATHGDRSIDNCHPFPVGADPRTVIAHNGVLPDIVRPGPKDPRSDTRITAEQFLPRFGSLRRRQIRRRLERWMTPANLMVVLTVDRRFKQRAYLLNEPCGIWDGGIWYSNDGYLPASLTRWHLAGDPGRHWPAPWDDLDPCAARCAFCDAVIDPTMADCPYCGWCHDCDQMSDDCQCYLPAALDRRFGSRRAGPG